MKMFLAGILSVAALIAGPGCERLNPTNTVQGPSGKKLSLAKPWNQTLKRGETNEIAISLDREKGLGSVKVKFDNLPKGVSVVEDTPIAADKTRAVYTLHAAPDAALVAKHEAKVTVSDSDGMAASQLFLIEVKEQPFEHGSEG